MQSVLIAEPSDDLRAELSRELRKCYTVFDCSDGPSCLQILSSKHPDGLILNLSLPGADGLHILESLPDPHPSAILTLAYIYPPYVLRLLPSLGVNYWLLLPCTLHTVTSRLNSLLTSDTWHAPETAQQAVSKILRKLKAPYWNGYEMLCVAAPLFAQDRTQLLTKDLYPAVAKLCNCDNWMQVEKGIRDLIRHIYENRDPDIWHQYILEPGYPSNRDFIYRLSELLEAQEDTDVVIEN